MRVLVATLHPYYPEHRGGAQAAIRDRCLYLRRRGVTPLVLCGRFGANGRDGEEEWEGQPLVRVADPAAALPGIAASFRPDVVSVEMGGSGPVGVAAMAAGLPTVAFQHDVGLDGALLRPGLQVLAASSFLAARCARLAGRRVAVAGSIVDLPRYTRPVAGLGDGVLFVNPIPSKGLYIALDIARSMPETRFRFRQNWPLPTGPDRELAALVRRVPNVEMLAPADSDAALYDGIGALLVPSVVEEGWGRVVTEAQAAGIPAVAADRGALPEATGAGGIVLPLHAATGAWVAALRRLLGPERAAWSAAARRRVADPDLDPGRLAARLAAMLEAACRKP
ncbi:MAG: glycosyltransferase [Alphaproteobacteria bacterium]|nr:glycosyltransferase [Alphaproteobacteria bacterium]